MRLIVVALGLLSVSLAGCSTSIAAAVGDGGPQYGTTVAYTYDDAQLAEVTALCTAVATCIEDRSCRGGFEPKHFDSLALETPWGKAMAAGLKSQGMERVGPEVATYIYNADLGWATPDCREVVKYFGL